MATTLGTAIDQARDFFYAGYYRQALAALKGAAPPSDLAEIEIETLTARCRFQLGDVTKSEIQKMDKSGRVALMALANHHLARTASSAAERQACVKKLRKFSVESANPSVKAVTAANLVEYDGDLSALNLAEGRTLEMLTLKVQLFLMIDRVDLASETLSQIVKIDEDSTFCKLATAWVALATGNPQEAYLTLEDLKGLHGEDGNINQNSSIILNGMAVANMQRGLWKEAQEDLEAQLTISALGSSSEETALANLIVCCTQLSQNDKSTEYLARLRTAKPLHPVFEKMQNLDNAFEKFEKTVKSDRNVSLDGNGP